MKARPLDCAGLQPDWPGADAGLLWAAATGFRDHLRPGQAPPTHWPVALELHAGHTAADLVAAGVRVPAAHQASGSRWLTGLMDLHALRAVGSGALQPAVRRVALQAPVLPHRPRSPGAGAEGSMPVAPSPQTQAAAAPAARAAPAEQTAYTAPVGTAPGPAPFARPRSTAPVLVGVIDNGCPFAHEMLRTASRRGTRVLALWDQDPLAPAFATRGGQVPEDFGYGAEIDRAGLDRLMAAAAAAHDPTVIDEARCYREAGYDVLRERFGHGAAVLGLLSSPRGSDPVQPRQAGPARRRVHGATTASAAADSHQGDFVFVQIPRDAVQDASSASLPRYLLDGLRYIVSCAAPGQRIVVNISDGTSRGTHDGRTLAEQALADLVREAGLPDPSGKAGASARPAPRLDIVLAAGNVGNEERHAQFDGLRPGAVQRVCLHVPAGNETPVFVNLRLPPGLACTVRVQAPGRDAISARPGQAVGGFEAHDAPCCGLLLPRPPGPAQPRLAETQARSAAQPGPHGKPDGCAPATDAGEPTAGLLVIAATRRGPADTPVAPSGCWWIEVEADAAAPASTAADAAAPGAAGGATDEPVHLWISRGQRNSTALPRSLQARFLDTDGQFSPARHRRETEHDARPPRSALRRAGSLSGLATLTAPGITVVGALLDREDEAAPYTSSGPAAGRGPQVRWGPDLAAPVDDSLGLPGLRVAGNRSGSVCRAMGSSFAAPQAAHNLASGRALLRPAGGPPEQDGARKGAGRLLHPHGRP